MLRKPACAAATPGTGCHIVGHSLQDFIASTVVDDWGEEEDVMGCETVWRCFLLTLNMGLRSGGGIGDFLGEPDLEYEIHNR